jgi:hypothetical protein
LKIYLESSPFVHLMIWKAIYKQYWKDFYKTIFSMFWSTAERVEILTSEGNWTWPNSLSLCISYRICLVT